MATTIGRTSYDDFQRMEALASGQRLGLDGYPQVAYSTQNRCPTTAPRRTSSEQAPPRIDLADFLALQATDQEWIGRVAALATVPGAPSLWPIAQQEAPQPKRY